MKIRPKSVRYDNNGEEVFFFEEELDVVVQGTIGGDDRWWSAETIANAAETAGLGQTSKVPRALKSTASPLSSTMTGFVQRNAPSSSYFERAAPSWRQSNE